MNLACVKCTSILDKARIDEIEVDLCPRCGGLWLDHGEVERLARKNPSETDRLRKLLAPKKGPPPVPSETKSACPSCTNVLREVALGPIQIDFCGRCKGLFLDRGELDQALALVKEAKTTVAGLIAAAAAEAPV